MAPGFWSSDYYDREQLSDGDSQIQFPPSQGSSSSCPEEYPSPPTSQSSGDFMPYQFSSNGGYVPGTMFYLELPRVFYPFTLCLPRPPTPQALTTYNPNTGLRNPLFHVSGDTGNGRPFTDFQTIVISTVAIGAESLAVYFGPNSKHNFSLLLRDAPQPHSHSHLAAEIFAAHKALKIGRAIANAFAADRVTIMKIVVAVSCELLFRVMTKWIDELNRTDWEGAGVYGGGVRENRVVFERLDRMVEEMVEEDGLEVAFWIVGDEEVGEARKLAREELAGC